METEPKKTEPVDPKKVEAEAEAARDARKAEAAESKKRLETLEALVKAQSDQISALMEAATAAPAAAPGTALEQIAIAVAELAKAQAKAEERQAKSDSIVEGLIKMVSMKDDAARVAAEEIARKRALVEKIMATAIELQSVDGKPPDVLKYVVGEVPHYRKGVLSKKGDLIALPLDDNPANRPSWTWKPYDPQKRTEDPQVAAERKALSQLAKEQAQKPVGPLAQAKKPARPSDTEV
jgi:hypothetical protein